MFAVFSLYSFTSELGLYALGRNAVASDAEAGTRRPMRRRRPIEAG